MTRFRWPVRDQAIVENHATSETDLQSASGDNAATGDVVTDHDAEAGPGQPPAGPGQPPVWRRVGSWVLTALAFGLVVFAIMAPDELDNLKLRDFVRIPLEGPLILAFVLLVPGKIGRVVVAVVGAFLGVLTIVQLVDMGFFATLSRPFNLVLDWAFLPDALDFLTTSIGRVGSTAVVIGIVLLAIALPVMMSRSLLRVTRIALQHRSIASGTVAVLGVAWIASATLGFQLASGEPFAAKAAVHLTSDRIGRVRQGLHDHTEFAKQSSYDKFAKTPASQLLTGLTGKNVMLTFVESYGRTAVQDPQFAPQIDTLLDAGTKELDAAGFASRSGWLTSPTAGGGSILAHSTLQSGLWINNRQRYKNLTASKRMSLNKYFKLANWNTIGLFPGISHPWPEGTYYGFDKLYPAADLAYKGPKFGFSTMPDQYTLEEFHRIMQANPTQRTTFMEVPLLSSHIPWAPLPTMIPWDQVGDGSVYTAQHAAGKTSAEVWRSANQVRVEYGKSIQYTLSALISYVKTYGDENLVLIFLGDHQPAPIVTGQHASRDVPITIVAKDPAVLKQIDSWGWNPGLRPNPNAPVWRMNSFRDKFLTAFSPGAQTTSKSGATILPQATTNPVATPTPGSTPTPGTTAASGATPTPVTTPPAATSLPASASPKPTLPPAVSK